MVLRSSSRCPYKKDGFTFFTDFSFVQRIQVPVNIDTFEMRNGTLYNKSWF